MALSFTTFTGDGATTNYTIPFEYIDRDHVKLEVDGVETEFTFVSDSVIKISPAPDSGARIFLYRSSSRSTRLVDYVSPSSLTEEDMDTDSLQAFYLAQEAIDVVDLTISQDASDGVWDADSRRIKNVSDPTEDQDAATKSYVDDISVEAGNVPTPDDPDDDGKFLKADSGSFDWDDVTAADISDATTTGKALVKATDAEAARDTLGVSDKVIAKTADYTVAVDDREKTVAVDATSAAATITLPAAATAGNGFIIDVKKTDADANNVTVDGNAAETIDGAETLVLDNQYDHVSLVCDGSAWHVRSTQFATNTEAQEGTATNKALTPANMNNRVCFSANKGGTDQTGIDSSNDTKVTFDNEEFDVGGYYDEPNSRWIPPAGRYRVSAQVRIVGSLVDTSEYVLILKIGTTAFRRNRTRASGTGAINISITTLVEVDGSEEISVSFTSSSDNVSIDGESVSSFFFGEAV